MEKVTLLEKIGQICIKGLYTFYGGEFACLRIVVDGYKAKVILKEDGEKDLSFETNINQLQSALIDFIKTGEGIAIGKSEYFSCKEENQKMVIGGISKDEVTITIKHTLQNSVVLSTNTAKEILRKVNKLVLRNMN